MTPSSPDDTGTLVFRHRLHRWYAVYAVSVVAFIALMVVLERVGLPRPWLGAVFLLAPVAMYAGIGLVCRTTNLSEYYVAGRRVPAVYNGMAIGADWMSAASFMGLAGTLLITGHAGLAYVMGWTGGFVLIALFIAPYLRRYGAYTIPDFLGERYGGTWPRLLGLVAAVLCSFTYVVAQIYGVGLITSRLTGFSFELGIFVGLGGILVCSFLGGMRAVTWTQVAQYIILLLAFLVPTVWLAIEHTGNPVPQWVAASQLQKITAREESLRADPREQEVMAAFHAEARRYDELLREVPTALERERSAAVARLAQARSSGASHIEVRAAERALWSVPKDEQAARDAWTRARTANEERARPLAGMPTHAQAYAGDPHGDAAARQAFGDSRANFLALVFCLMAGTAGLPHLLTRFYTTPTVAEARSSVTWAVLCIAVLYITAPALALLLKVEILDTLVGARFDSLPGWITQWSKVDPNLLSVVDINRDGVLQLGELRISSDILVLAAPEIGGMPFVVSCMVAAGALAAALSTADGLLLTIASALSHDFYYRMVDREAPAARRVAISKVVLLVVALLAAYVAAQKPADILLLVTPVFSVAAATIFPALVLGLFWSRANRAGAVAGMVAGFVVTVAYMAATHPVLHRWLGLASPAGLWWGIQSLASGVFGVPAAFAANLLASLATAAPSEETRRWVRRLRRPGV